jgi:ubiquinone/menaquinone biosynthesis C-methylase UbiE
VRRADYSRIAPYYDEARPEPADIWIKTIVQLANIAQESCVLDVGCGTGRFTVRVSRHHNGAAYGIDNSIDMLRKAARREAGRVLAGGKPQTQHSRKQAGAAASRRVNWIAGDAFSIPLRSASIDCVYMTMVIHHIRRSVLALREIRRVLRPGGTCLVMTSSHSAIRAHVLRHFPGVVATDLKRFPTVPSLRAALRTVGFRNVRSRLVRYNEEEIPVEKYLNMVKKKYISTFSIMDERKFERGLRVFERKLAHVYGKRMRRTLAFTFVTGEKP